MYSRDKSQTSSMIFANIPAIKHKGKSFLCVNLPYLRLSEVSLHTQTSLRATKNKLAELLPFMRMCLEAPVET